MLPEIEKYLYDIITSIDSIYSYLGEKRDFKAYLENKQLRRAIERELEIIGEAAGRILKIEPSINIENAKRIVALRNWVIHGYDKVDDTIIWGIISKDLSVLYEQVKILI